jgi:hypothetical protein
MLINTVNVKMRYEQIISNILENERIGLSLSVPQIIENTKQAEQTLLEAE